MASTDPTPPAPRPLASRRAAFLLLKPPEELDADQRAMVERFCEASPDVAIASNLARRFADMVRRRQGHRLDGWLEAVRASNMRELEPSLKACGATMRPLRLACRCRGALVRRKVT